MPRIEIETEVEIENILSRRWRRGQRIIAKRLDGPYQAGARDFNWIKYKKLYAVSAGRHN